VKLTRFSDCVAVAGFCLVSAVSSAQKVYRWVDDQGVVHFGDRVPPEYADQDRDILNHQAVTVGFEEGVVTEAERAELERLAAEEEARRLAREATARRDRVLLDTYLSVSDITELRDRRLELLDSQIKVTEQYLANLRKHLSSLEREGEQYENGDGGAAGLPPQLALEISRVLASISLYEENLDRTRVEQDELREAFEADIERFRQLKGDDG
jgi:hypothetical protein